jgi:drug/metabolite transporter (DMT)-like permease
MFSAALLVVSQGIWAVYYILCSVALTGFQYPAIFATMRIWLAVFPMGVVAGITDRERVIPPKKCLPSLVLLGLISGCGSQMLFLFGLYYSNPVIASLSGPTTPALVSLVAMTTKKERFSWMKVAGIMSTICGCLIVIFMRPLFTDANVGSAIEGRNVPLGASLCFATTLLNTWSIFVQKNVTGVMPVISINAVYFVFGAVFVSIFLGIDVLVIEPGLNVGTAVASMDGRVWLTIAYGVLVGSTLGYIIYSVALKFSSPLFCTAFQPLQPVLSAVLSWVVFGSMPLGSDYIGAVLIISGLVIVLYAKSREMPVYDQSQKGLAGKGTSAKEMDAFGDTDGVDDADQGHAGAFMALEEDEGAYAEDDDDLRVR